MAQSTLIPSATLPSLPSHSRPAPSGRAIILSKKRPVGIPVHLGSQFLKPGVPPELVFDKGLGELFVIRVAGNIPDPIVLGSIEYAAEHLGSPLIMVLGRERCGAVTAAVDAKGKPEGNIGAIVKTIASATAKARLACKGKDRATLVECAVDENIRNVAAEIPKQSRVIRTLVAEGKVKIVMAKYDLDDGKVTLLPK